MSKRSDRMLRWLATAFTVSVAGACGVLLLYLLLTPVVMKGRAAFRPRVMNLNDARNYYTVLSAAVASIVGATGLVLGGVYYLHRLRWEDARSQRELKLDRLDDLIQRLEAIDEKVSEVLFLSGNHGSIVEHVHKILQALSTVAELLDHAADLHVVGDEAIRAVVRFYSYIERPCRRLLENGPEAEQRRPGDRLFDPDEYADLLHDARRELHRCAENLSRATRSRAD